MRRLLLPMLAVIPALLLSGCGGSSSSDTDSGDTDSTSVSSSDTGGDADTDSAVVACQDFQEAVNDWSSHAINRSELFDQLVQVRKNAVLSEHQDIVETGGALLAAMTESDSTFAASIKNFDNACAHANH